MLLYVYSFRIFTICTKKLQLLLQHLTIQLSNYWLINISVTSHLTPPVVSDLNKISVCFIKIVQSAGLLITAYIVGTDLCRKKKTGITVRRLQHAFMLFLGHFRFLFVYFYNTTKNVSMAGKHERNDLEA